MDTNHRADYESHPAAECPSLGPTCPGETWHTGIACRSGNSHIYGQAFVDYHVHTRFSRDARPSLRECCCAAVQNGLREIGFADHVTLSDMQNDTFRRELAAYGNELVRCRAMFPSIDIRFGLEVDFVPGILDHTSRWLGAVEADLCGRLDFLLGAVHEVRGRSLIYRDSVGKLLSALGADRLFREYFELERQAACSGVFDIIAHPDLVSKFAGELFFHDRLELANQASDFLDGLLSNRVALEINTKGLIHPVGEIHPSQPLLDLYVRLAQEANRTPLITVGSDAHDAGRVGANIAEALTRLTEAGEEAVVTFRRRVPHLIRLGT